MDRNVNGGVRPEQMHRYTAQVVWNRGEQPFVDNRFSRRHTISFDGGTTFAGSSSPHVTRVPFSDPSAADPEELFVASLSSCHMLWFLYIAASRKLRVDSYADRAEGTMEKNRNGKLAISIVTLRPEVAFSGPVLPPWSEVLALHDEAHANCFIANSVLTEVRCEPVP
jgi:organic hydroperoxide reductase OsmC/OhrA